MTKQEATKADPTENFPQVDTAEVALEQVQERAQVQGMAAVLEVEMDQEAEAVLALETDQAII